MGITAKPYGKLRSRIAKVERQLKLEQEQAKKVKPKKKDKEQVNAEEE